MNCKLMNILTICLLSVSLAPFAGCDDEEENTPQTPCAQAYDKICQKACDCSEEGCFYFFNGSSSDYTDEEGCYDLSVEFSCEEEDYPADLDFDACIDALKSATCREHDLWTKTGLELPTECAGL